MNGLIISMYAVALALLGGWCANIYKIFSNGFAVAEWGGMEILRIIGVFMAPLGGVLGFL